MAESHLRPGWPALVPYLIVDDAQRLLEWLPRAFGAEIDEVDHNSDGSVMHSTVRMPGGGVLEISDSREEHPARPCTLHWYVPDVDKLYEGAVAMGAASLMPPSQMPYGERAAGITDPGGNHWYLAQYKA